MNSIESIDVPTKVCDMRQFVILDNYYRYIWNKFTHTLAPLNKLCPTKVKFNPADLEHKSFVEMKIIVGRYFLL